MIYRIIDPAGNHVLLADAYSLTVAEWIADRACQKGHILLSIILRMDLQDVKTSEVCRSMRRSM
jgi:hypothetical protein